MLFYLTRASDFFFFFNKRLLLCLEITPATLFGPSFCLVRVVSIRVIAAGLTKSRPERGSQASCQYPRCMLQNWSLGDAAKDRVPLRSPYGKVSLHDYKK